MYAEGLRAPVPRATVVSSVPDLLMDSPRSSGCQPRWRLPTSGSEAWRTRAP